MLLDIPSVATIHNFLTLLPDSMRGHEQEVVFRAGFLERSLLCVFLVIQIEMTNN